MTTSTPSSAESAPAATSTSKGQIGPWVVSAVLAIALGFTWVTMSGKVEQKEVQLQQKDAQLTAMHDRYNGLVSDANRKLENANRQYNALADEANQKLRSANQPEVEVQAGFRKAVLHSGGVAVLRNMSRSTIGISAEIERPSTGVRRAYELTLDPGQTREIGSVEGWAFIGGDSIRISQPGHKPLTFVAP
jgi:hypothetical protein